MTKKELNKRLFQELSSFRSRKADQQKSWSRERAIQELEECFRLLNDKSYS